MATVKGRNNTKIFIDGVPVENLMQWCAERDIHDIGPFIAEVTYTRFAHATIRVELNTIRNTTLSFDIPDNQILNTEDAIYIIGPLRELFPSLFEGKDLLAWQLAYLEFSNENKAARFIYQRDNEYFITPFARNFQAGYERAYAAGYKVGESKGYEKGRKDETEYQQQINKKRKNKWSKNS